MKILYLHQYYNNKEMSGGTRSYEMAKRLAANGHEVHIVTSWREKKENKSWFETNEDNIHVHWLPIEYSNEMTFSKRIMAFFKFAIAASKKSFSIKSDIIFATSTPLTIAIPAVIASRLQKIPMVFEVRDLWPELPIAVGALKNPVTRFLARSLEKWAYDNADSIVALSPGMKEGVVKRGVSPESVAVIPNSCDIDFFRISNDAGKSFRSQRPWLKDKPLLIYTGTFGIINGVAYIVNLAVKLKNIAPDVRILLVGGGGEYNSVCQLAKEKNVLGKNLFIESKLPKKNIPALLNAATMACSLFIDKPEMRANSANKFFDALAAGKPIMINYGGWQKELLESHDAGLVVWNKSIENAAASIAIALHDTQWLAKASKSAGYLAENVFNRDRLASQLEEVMLATKLGDTHKVASIAPGEFNTPI